MLTSLSEKEWTQTQKEAIASKTHKASTIVMDSRFEESHTPYETRKINEILDGIGFFRVNTGGNPVPSSDYKKFGIEQGTPYGDWYYNFSFSILTSCKDEVYARLRAAGYDPMEPSQREIPIGAYRGWDRN